MRNKLAMCLAVFAGVLLLSTGINGAATWQTIRNFVVGVFLDHWALILLFQILIFVASLGGIAVILGGVLIGYGRVFVGKLFILLGVGTGLFGLVIAVIIPWIHQGDPSLAFGGTTGTLGVILSVVARMMAK
ncbi:MAG TPA: hypothetical protein ENG51_19720 [Deltaproteobacteria bacterium]|nr:hypothetical protein [Deltaproteobacteria bacterium]